MLNSIIVQIAGSVENPLEGDKVLKSVIPAGATVSLCNLSPRVQFEITLPSGYNRDLAYSNITKLLGHELDNIWHGKTPDDLKSDQEKERQFFNRIDEFKDKTAEEVYATLSKESIRQVKPTTTEEMCKDTSVESCS